MIDRYPIKTSEFSSHALVSKLIESLNPNIILDLGCGTGTLTASFVAKGKIVFGIEIDERDAQIAQINGLIVSVQSLDSKTTLPSNKIELVIAADILEHLQNPEEFLIYLRKQLPKNVKLIVSIPNVANIYVRLSLLFGKFNYTDRGILDKTHLRFFTRKTLLDMFASSGYEFKLLNYTPIPIEEILPDWIPSIASKIIDRTLWELTKFAPTILGYQFIGVATSK
jgi:2-polyprenyl-3-methyl-5-hydroxy-6-metoxy-1,4-benzoquinol methylase